MLLLLLLFVELPGTWTARGGEWADRPTSSREPGTEPPIHYIFFILPNRGVLPAWIRFSIVGGECRGRFSA